MGHGRVRLDRGASALVWSVGLACLGACSADYCSADFSPYDGHGGGDDHAGDGSGSDDGHFAHPHRVAVWMVGVFVAFYGIVIGLFVAGIRCLRKGPTRRYAEALAAGEITEDHTPGAEAGKGGSEAALARGDGWMSKPIAAVHKDNGLDAALYLMHCRHMATYCTAQMCTMGALLLLTYTTQGYYEHSLAMFALSYANLADTEESRDWSRFVPVVMSWWCVISTTLFAFYKQRSMDHFKHEVDVDRGSGSTSQFTVWIKGVSKSATEDDLSAFLDAHFQGQVKSAKLVWDCHDLGHNLRARRNLIQKINVLQDKLGSQDNKRPDKTLARINLLKAKLQQLSQYEPALRAKKLTCAGSAFVTFRSSTDTNTFRMALAKYDGSFPSSNALSTGDWHAKMAPKPSEIYWENFGLTSAQRRHNKIKTLTAQLGMYLAFIFVALGAVWCIGFDYMYYLYGMAPQDWAIEFICPQKEATGLFVWYGILALFFIISFLVLEEEMAPIIKFVSKFDSPKTKSIKQSVYLGKCYWFYVIYHWLLSTTVLGWLANNVQVDPAMHKNDASEGAIKLYIEAVGAFHQHRVFLTVGVIDMLHAMEGLKYFTRKQNELTEEEQAKFQGAEQTEDETDAGTPLDEFFSDKFDFSRNYGETIGVFTSICYYQVMHPTILVCGAIYYLTKMYVDKYQICCQYSKPRIQYGRRARTTTTYIFWSLTVGQMGNCVYYLFLVPDLLVGALMVGSFLAAATVFALYKYQPQRLKTKKTTNRAVKKEAMSATKAAAGGADPFVDGETNTEPEYNPPKPSELSVGVMLNSGAATKIEVVNPMLMGDAEMA